MNGFLSQISLAWKAWTNFWFTPAEPTTLGFIRVITGIVLVYTHLVYCFDLNGFFGKHAWYDLESINRERRETPHVSPDFWSWEDYQKSAFLPTQPHRKSAVVAWVQSMTADDKTRAATIRFLKEIETIGDFDTPRQVMLYISQLRSDPVARKGQLDAIVNESQRTPLDPIPQGIKNLPEKGPKSREEMRAAIERFHDTLPKDDNDRGYILNFFMELNYLSRPEWVSFLEKLPQDKTARLAEIDYLSYWGFDRTKSIRQGQPIFSMWFYLTGEVEMAVAHTITIIVMVLFTLGLWTRVTSVLTWFLAVNYIHRTQYVLFGMDTMSNILLIYLMIGNSGGAFSLDRMIARFRATRASLRKTGGIDAETALFLEKPPATMSSGLGLRLLQVHFCFIYMAAGLSKLKGPAWWSHQAYWDTTANPEFTMICFQWYESALRWLVGQRWLYSLTAAIAIAHTFIAEIGLPFLIWTRARPWIMIIGCLLHAGIAIFMGLTVFSLLMMLLLMCFLPGVTIRTRIFGTKGPIRTLTFNPKNDQHIAIASRAVAIDTEDSVELKPSPTASEVTMSMNGKSVDYPTSELLKASNFLSPLTWIPGFTTIARRWLV